MWQRKRGSEEYHLLWDINADLNGKEVQTACGELVVVNINDQMINPYLVPGCALCVPIWHLVSTSVHDALGELKHVDNLKVLQRAQELTKSVSLRKAFGARVRKLERATEKERKLRLIQSAYD
jgi:hypothetical protein